MQKKEAGRLAETEPQRWMARNIRYRREQLGLTQQELADRLDASYSWVSHLETGDNSNIQIDTLFGIASALEIDPAFFLRANPELWTHTQREGTRRIEHSWPTN